MESDWLHEADGRATLTLHIQPGAKKTEVVGVIDDALKIKLQAQPVEGQANAALVKWLAKELKVARGAVTITHGATSRRKLIELGGVSAQELMLHWPL